MPVRPNVLERLLLLRLNRGPGPAVDLFGAAGFRALALAIELDLFDTLREPATLSSLVAETDCDPDGLSALLGLLDQLGYVAGDGEEWRATAMATRWLTDVGGTNLAPWFRFWHEIVFPFWETSLATAVREGEPPATLYDHLGDDADAWAIAQAGFAATASLVADSVVDRAAEFLPPGGRLLDVGGGHGEYAVAAVERVPDATATVFDRPVAVDVAADTAAGAGVADRVEPVAGDYLVDDLGAGFDCALVCNVLHGHDAGEATQLLERTFGALASGGGLVVLDQFAGAAPTPMARLGVAFVDLTYLATLGTRAHPVAVVRDWVEDAGFEDVQRHRLWSVPGTTMLTARKPS